jgi:uncharacterized membrane protein YhhN
MTSWHYVNWLFIAAVLWGVAYGVTLANWPQSHLRAAAKTVPVALLAVTAYAANMPGLLVLALALSALGDFFLAYEGERNFLAGLVSFLLAHVSYIVLFFGQQDPVWSGTLPFFAGTVLVFAFSMSVFRRLRPHLGPMRLPVALYTGILSAMAVAALARGPDPLLIAGVVLLVASDAVLAFERFTFEPQSAHRRWSGAFVWFTYLFGQALVTSAFVFAVA